MSTQNQQLNERTLSDLIIEYLELLGVEYVFGIPGVHTMAFYEALSRSERRGGVRAVHARHESGAAWMAAAYARETGKLGVCCVTSGPGATNVLTGAAVASSDHAPILIISGQGVTPHYGRGTVQESAPYASSSPDVIDTTGMFEYCTRYNSVVSHPKQMEHKLLAAITCAFQHLRGAVHLGIPPNILGAPADGPLSSPNLAQKLQLTDSFMDNASVDRMWRQVQDVALRGGRILLHIGQECQGATDQIMELAERLNAPIIYTVPGKSWVRPYHPLARGVFGPLWSHHTSFMALLDGPRHDLVLSLGTILSQADTSDWMSEILNENLVHVYPARDYFTRSSMAGVQVLGAVKTVLIEINRRLAEAQASGDLPPSAFIPPPAEAERPLWPVNTTIHKPELCHSNDVPLKPQRIAFELSRYMPPETRFIIDIGNCLPWSAHYMFLENPENYRTFFSQPSMGSSPGSAVGTAMGAPKGTPVVAFIGDGAFQMYGQEISVAVAEKLPIIFAIINDGAFGMVKLRHRQVGEEPVDLDLAPVDFKLMAQAVGAQGFTISTPEDLVALDYTAMRQRPGPTVLDFRIDPDESLPMGVSEDDTYQR